MTIFFQIAYIHIPLFSILDIYFDRAYFDQNPT